MHFTTMAKPVGSLCNMNCSYCYYLHADSGQDISTFRMSDEVLEEYIRSYSEACEGNEIAFTWHGGEPTLAGIPFFEKVIALQKKYIPAGRHAVNAIQTNGLLIDDAWCRFFRDNQFEIGLSIDGTRMIHDMYRSDAGGEDTYGKVRNALYCFERHGIRPDLLCTVTAETAASARAVYDTLKNYHTGWIQFIPIVRRNDDGTVTEDSVSPQAYGRFLKTVFREWITHDLGRVNVQLFAETALMLAGKPATVCWLSETCGNILIAEKDGTVFACDHFVDREHRLGNLCETPIGEMAESPFQKQFGAEKKNLCRACRECEWLSLCHGCCPKDRFLINEDGERQYYLCEGMKMYFEEAVPALRTAMEMSTKGKSQKEIMKHFLRK